jgi:hypothetical protein
MQSKKFVVSLWASGSTAAIVRPETRIVLQPTSSNKINTPSDIRKRKHFQPLHPPTINPMPTIHYSFVTTLSPPAWLTSSLTSLSAQYPNNIFEGVMQYFCVNTETGQCVPVPLEGQPVPTKHTSGASSAHTVPRLPWKAVHSGL